MMHSDMEYQIHVLEQEAYGAVLRAFKAQSDALTWVDICLSPCPPVMKFSALLTWLNVIYLFPGEGRSDH